MQEKRAITFDDVLLVPSYNHYESRRLVQTQMADKVGKLTLDLPLMSANMDTVTGYKMANFMGEKGAIGVLHRYFNLEDNVSEFKKCAHKVFVSVGCGNKELERAIALREAGADYFCLDVAHSHAKYVGKMLKNLRELAKDACIMAGNVATYAGADYLAANGADIIKAGIGGGSVCTTRIKTGFGVPMLSCVTECARVDRSIVADGGFRTPSDIVKALAFGADFVMIGSMLSGTSVTPGEVIDGADGVKYKRYRGMASQEAQENFMGTMHEWKTPEGVATKVPYNEDEEAIIGDIVGGLRSGLTYGGSSNIKELQRKLDYLLISNAARIESMAHKLM